MVSEGNDHNKSDYAETVAHPEVGRDSRRKIKVGRDSTSVLTHSSRSWLFSALRKS